MRASINKDNTSLSTSQRTSDECWEQRSPALHTRLRGQRLSRVILQPCLSTAGLLASRFAHWEKHKHRLLITNTSCWLLKGSAVQCVTNYSKLQHVWSSDMWQSTVIHHVAHGMGGIPRELQKYWLLSRLKNGKNSSFFCSFFNPEYKLCHPGKLILQIITVSLSQQRTCCLCYKLVRGEITRLPNLIRAGLRQGTQWG